MPQRRPLMAGNWKMHLKAAQARALAEEVAQRTAAGGGVEVMIAPPFTSIFAVAQALAGSGVALGAQNLYPADEGAFTGEISPLMLVDLGVSYVIVGHSERRHVLGESDDFIRQKVAAALTHRLRPVLCLGETLNQRQAGETEAVIEDQFRLGLEGLEAGQVRGLVIAYEPVWAIGTGQTATPAQAQAVHAFIRQLLTDRFDKGIANSTRILYGGSVKAENTAVLMAEEDIDGALVGGASLEAESFGAIVAAGG